MKLYDTQMAPNPRRVRIFLAEKGIEVPSEQVDLMKGEQRSDEFRKKNPMMRVPVLELDDGTNLAESVAICRYFEEKQPEPNLMGKSAEDKAVIEMWQRRMESEIFNNVGMFFRNTNEMAKALEPNPNKPLGEAAGRAVEKRLKWLDEELGNRKYIAGDAYSIADITALCAIDFAQFAGIKIPDDCKNLQRWYQDVSSRPSAKA